MSASLSNSPKPSGDSTGPLGEISQGPGRFELFLDRNQRSLFALAVLLVIAAIGLVIYRGVSEGRQKSAGAALSKAEDLPSLQGVLKNHENTIAAGSAAVLLADHQWADGDQDAAIQTLQNLISSHPGHAAIPSARASLASKLSSQGKNEEARAQFQAILDDSSARFLAPYALIYLGDLERAANDTSAARSFYDRARIEFPDSNFAETANRRLALLNAAAPVEIDPPPAPEEAAPPISVPPMLAPPSLRPGLQSAESAAASEFFPEESAEETPESAEIPEAPPGVSEEPSPEEEPAPPSSSEP